MQDADDSVLSCRVYECVTDMSCRVAFLPMQALRKHSHIDRHASIALFGGLIMCDANFSYGIYCDRMHALVQA